VHSVSLMHDLCDKYPVNLMPMIGLHPCDVKENYMADLEVLYEHLCTKKYVGIGEVEMDLHWDVSTKEWQKQALLTQVEWAVEKKLPLSLHTRNATLEVIQLLKPYKGKIHGVFHCFSESEELAMEIIKLGFYLGIGGVLTFKKAGIREVVKRIGIDRLVLETDSPYLAPTPYRGKRNEPAYIPIIADEIAHLTGLSAVEVAAITTKNAEDIFACF